MLCPPLPWARHGPDSSRPATCPGEAAKPLSGTEVLGNGEGSGPHYTCIPGLRGRPGPQTHKTLNP